MNAAVVEPAPVEPVSAADDSGTSIFGDEQDVATPRPRILPLVAALVGVGLLVGGAVAIVAAVSAPAWSIGGQALAGTGGETFGTYRSSAVDAAIRVELPADSIVLDFGEGVVGGADGTVARVSFSTDPTGLLESSGYSLSSDVPTDLLAAQGDDFANPRFFIAIDGDDVYTALVGDTGDGRVLASFSAPLAD